MNAELLQIAFSLYGLKEMPGAGDNPEILQMAKDCGFADYIHDSIAWCSMAMNWVAWKAGFERSHSLAARSWLTVGEAVQTPELGDIVVFWRIDPNGLYAHVGFPMSRRNGLIYTLGGNEADAYQIEGYDPAKALGYRRLSSLK